MNPSLFLALVQAYFPALVLRVVAKYNDNSLAGNYLYRQFLRNEFSVDGKWGTLSVNNSLVAADIVALDSPLPLKRRPTMGQYSGDIPKMGMEFSLNETELTNLQSLVARLNYNGSSTQAQIVAQLFRDVDACVGGIYERLEAMFLQGLSTGMTIVDDSETVGAGIRIDYKYPLANAGGAAQSWDDTTNARPISDIQKMLDRVNTDGNSVTRLMMDLVTFNQMAATNEAKQTWAASAGFIGAAVPVPTLEQVQQTFEKKFGLGIQIVNRVVRYQRNGNNVAFKPWKAGAVVGIPGDQIGRIVHARLAEMDYPVVGVEYQIADEFILLSKFNENRPSLKEVTNSQARAVPVIDNVQSIYTLDTTIDNG